VSDGKVEEKQGPEMQWDEWIPIAWLGHVAMLTRCPGFTGGLR